MRLSSAMGQHNATAVQPHHFQLPALVQRVKPREVPAEVLGVVRQEKPHARPALPQQFLGEALVLGGGPRVRRPVTASLVLRHHPDDDDLPAGA
jgi:hypothetical protein